MDAGNQFRLFASNLIEAKSSDRHTAVDSLWMNAILSGSSKVHGLFAFSQIGLLPAANWAARRCENKVLVTFAFCTRYGPESVERLHSAVVALDGRLAGFRKLNLIFLVFLCHWRTAE
jgi:hypothetical protein